MEDKQKIDDAFSKMMEKEQAVLDQAVKEYFGKHWPDLSTEEGRNTPMTFTPFAVMRLATHFYHLGQRAMEIPKVKGRKMLRKMECPHPLEWYMDESGVEHCWGYMFNEPCPWPADVYIKEAKEEDK